MSLATEDIRDGDSRPVHSNQPGPHPRLEEVVRRHAATRWRQPLHAATAAAFERLETLRADAGKDHPVVLDAGCGTGESTRRLGERFPGHLVVGVDRSAHRLERVGAAETPRQVGNVIWCRGELGSFWRLALAHHWPVTHQFLLYPNPWPKAGHLGRRWHGHPVFPTLVALGGRLELRSNWALYAEEFALALGVLLDAAPPPVRHFTARPPPLTPFERKYAASGHALHRVVIELP